MAELVSEDGPERTERHPIEDSNAEDQTSLAPRAHLPEETSALHDGDLGPRGQVHGIHRRGLQTLGDVLQYGTQIRVLLELELELETRVLVLCSHEQTSEDRPRGRECDDRYE